MILRMGPEKFKCHLESRRALPSAREGLKPIYQGSLWNL
jgi:hypothetical protein